MTGVKGDMVVGVKLEIELLSTDPLSWIFRGSFVYLFVLGKSVILPVLKSANLVWFL